MEISCLVEVRAFLVILFRTDENWCELFFFRCTLLQLINKLLESKSSSWAFSVPSKYDNLGTSLVWLPSASTLKVIFGAGGSYLAGISPPRPVSWKIQTGLIWQLNWVRPLVQRANIDYERKAVRQGDEMKGQKQAGRRKRRRPTVPYGQNIISMTYVTSHPLLITSTSRPNAVFPKVTLSYKLRKTLKPWLASQREPWPLRCSVGNIVLPACQTLLFILFLLSYG